MAGGSQIIINKDGITLITPGNLSQSWTTPFKGGEKANYSLPEIPNVQSPFSNKLDVYNLFPNTSNIKYSVLHSNGQVKLASLINMVGLDVSDHRNRKKLKFLLVEMNGTTILVVLVELLRIILILNS